MYMYALVLKKFNKFFQLRKNTDSEHAQLNLQSQLPVGIAEQFITSLHVLADSCDHGNLKEKMIRDRIVVGIRDKAF